MGAHCLKYGGKYGGNWGAIGGLTIPDHVATRRDWVEWGRLGRVYCPGLIGAVCWVDWATTDNLGGAGNWLGLARAGSFSRQIAYFLGKTKGLP